MTDKILTEASNKLKAIEESKSPEEEKIDMLVALMRRATEDDDEAAYKRAVTRLNALTDKMNAEQQVNEGTDPQVLHDAAIDMLDDMLDALPEEDHYGPRGDVIRYAMGRLQEVGLGR